ncbi:hypothetical protein [Microbacterium profundi]|nr:hypothetical protein [Microbacterium profundi]
MLSILTLVRIAEALKTPPGEFIDDLAADMFSPGPQKAHRRAG